MTVQDVQCVLEVLKFGGELETRITSEISDQSTSFGILYRLATQTPSVANLANIPCTICLVSVSGIKLVKVIFNW